MSPTRRLLRAALVIEGLEEVLPEDPQVLQELLQLLQELLLLPRHSPHLRRSRRVGQGDSARRLAWGGRARLGCSRI